MQKPSCQNLYLDDDNHTLVLLDQTLLPGKTHYLQLKDADSVRQAIVSMQVRGAPAIGLCAAMGYYLEANLLADHLLPDFVSRLKITKQSLQSARPTAVNLSWALGRMQEVVDQNLHLSPRQIVALLHQTALRLQQEDIDACRQIGIHGLSLLKKGDGILTHCNAGALATSCYGTATAPLYLGHENGFQFRIYVDETRPLLQGSRLTAYELSKAGMDVTLLCDNMAADVMQKGLIQAVLVGCDRVATNGDTANKIGTLGVAVLCQHFGIPFYVCAPLSTLDIATPSGNDIHIEERDTQEITHGYYQQSIAPQGIKAYNPAFDVTPHSLITAFITQKGIITTPFHENFLKILDTPSTIE